ncbi:MAG: LemA family protein [Candidatus Altiarchaeota archaeon]|nr:LemA family protein [Candidatus Altiarchaeota archaeon]
MLWGISVYNSLVASDNNVNEKWAQVENQYQRRIDLIPNLVNTVKGYATHEQQLFTEIAELRSGWTKSKEAGDRAGEIDAAVKMDSALGRLLVVVENYPELKANENFLALQSQLEGTENRIAVERMRYNEALRDYNIQVSSIPDRFIASLAGFEQKPYFQAKEGAENPPEVVF